MTEIAPPQAMLLQAAEARQSQASDPSVSAWVRANAGTGKTHVLVKRILRLLLSGAEPRSILCLTYTKNAAAEMEARVLAELSRWATADDAALKAALANLTGRAPALDEYRIARTLFATVVDAPNGLGIATIHAFCERVLRSFSLEANVPSGFVLMTEEEARDVLIAATASALTATGDTAQREAFATIVANAGEYEFDRVLQAMLCERAALTHLLSRSNSADPIRDAKTRLRDIFGLAQDCHRGALLRAASGLMNDKFIEEAASALYGGVKTDRETASRLRSVLSMHDDETKVLALKTVFCTDKGTLRAALMTTAAKTRVPAVFQSLCQAQAAFVALWDKLCAVKVVDATAALFRIAADVLAHYDSEKRSRGALDFDDLIEKTASLMSQPGAGEWVLYRLDARLDHILIDEAQDTSPAQWQIVSRLTEDFFSGAGARTRVPTVFAVGDEKQSIYGFQGARPEQLGENARYYRERVEGAGFQWRETDLALSFRTLGSILSAVDAVCKTLPGMDPEALIPHAAYRSGCGIVELWEPEQGEKEQKGDVWHPEDDTGSVVAPEARLSEKIADRIAGWLESGEVLESTGEPIAPGDILVLVRKREPMARLLQRALKARAIPVAPADRVALLDTLAVMDLLALCDVLLLPADDLSLATVLKSPLFGLSEDDVFDLAFERGLSLWQAVCDKRRDIATVLGVWKPLAHQSAPFDFFAHILDTCRKREAFAARLGPECHEALDELLTLAHAFGDRTLSEFLVFVRRSASEVKRESGQAAREVRIMTVHGAKGLEANVVILADACGPSRAGAASVVVLDTGDGRARIPVWAVSGTSRIPPLSEALERRKSALEHEYGRLLYVAMTRARDRLYITGFHKTARVHEACWYSIVGQAIGQSPEGRSSAKIEKFPVSRAGVKPIQRTATTPVYSRKPLPEWAFRPAPPERPLRILSPSRLEGFVDVSIHAAGHSPSAGFTGGRDGGTFLHRLLEILIGFPAPDHRAIVDLVASMTGNNLSPQGARELGHRAMSILSGLPCAPSAQSLAEAGFAMALGATPHGALTITGQVDLMLIGEDGVTVVDYKSSTEGAANAFAQIAAYRAALQCIFSQSSVRGAVLNAAGGSIVYQDEKAMDAVLARLTRTPPS